ncbi:TetR family transcriptional regulator (plasmid) [Streptomyces sp. NBC_01267]|uniref:TetR/AcrR family transcriptional regulator n=1 Tax=Streptomyces sp. NBC_01267 TaxID=2903805 RepID=UPI002E36F23B|nr:TetR family transcriptional regulator [Streptomyces sp. NBC_01267]
MPRSGQSVGTPARLLAAAREEFAAHGMAGARVSRIAEQAGANKERIYGYFGSKEKLFAAVVSEAVTEHATLLGPPTGDPAEYAGRIYDLHQQNPQLLRLMMWEALYYDAGDLPDKQSRAARYRASVETLAKALGTEPDSRAANTLLALIGVAILPTVFPQISQLILGSAPDEDADVRGHIVRLARRMAPVGPAECAER